MPIKNPAEWRLLHRVPRTGVQKPTLGMGSDRGRSACGVLHTEPMKRTARLLVLGAAAATTLAAASCSGGSTDVAGTSWGAAPGTQGEPSITFERDGSYAGNDGCNSLGGEWEADGDTIDLGVMHSTMMYCEGVDAWLAKSSSAKAADDELVFSDADGKRLGSLSPFDG